MNDRHNSEDRVTLQLLDVIGKQNNLSQRHLARHMGVALGLTNSYLRRCARKGFIKITKAPANRYLYYLTPKGFTEKARLTASYLSHSFSFYHEAGDSCIRVFSLCKQNGWDRILLCGMSDLAEIALLRGIEAKLEIVGIYDRLTKQKMFLSKPVWRELKNVNIPICNAYILTDIATSQATLEHLLSYVESERILIPDILRLDNKAAT